jgi:stage II sporulation protein AA (anti-sigma F factor antagonist)
MPVSDTRTLERGSSKSAFLPKNRTGLDISGTYAPDILSNIVKDICSMRERRPEVTEYDHHAIVRASGSLGEDGAQHVRAMIMTCLSNGDRQLVLDMKAVPYINSDGLRMLQDVLRQAETAQASLALARPNSSVLRTLRLTQMDKQAPIYDSVEAALKG